MSVLGRLLVASAERIDLPDLLSVDSFVAGDFKYLLKGLVGDGKPLILKGFDVINPGDAIGSQSISVRVADSVVLYPGSNAGPFFHGLEEGNAAAEPVVPELRKNATNFVYLTFSTFETARDTRAFWDPDLDGGVGGEFTQDINTESVLKVEINVSTASFPENTIPVCKVVVGPAVIESIQDARDMMFRLGQGGISPDPFERYNFRAEPSAPYARHEPPTTMSSALDPNPFQGADKNIRNLKEWMDAVMTKLAELGGTTFWYEDASTYSLVNLFLDALATNYKSKGKWEHSSSTPGQLTWTEDIIVKSIPDQRDIILRSGSKTLNDEEVMYFPIIRDADFNSGDVPVSWFNGLNIVNGIVGSFQNLVKGDWVKKKGDPNHNHLRVEEFYANVNHTGGVTTAALARSIKLSGNYQGLTQTERGSRTKGVYLSSEILVTTRDASTMEDLGGNLHWLAVRTDTIMNLASIVTTTVTGDITEGDGVTAKFTAGSAHGLIDGDRITISGSTNYDGTYVVEVESSTVFYINTTETTDESGVNGYYAIATTTTRSTPDGLQLESANHNFADNETIVIADTSSSFDGQHLVKVRSATTFSIAVDSAIPTVSTGTATLPRVNVRSEFALMELAMGESIGIGVPDSANILSYIGMGSLAETHPTYNIPPDYNTLDGMQNYNGETTDNLTVRVSKLTAMMADKAQDKTIKLLPHGYASVTNTTNGAFQDITFNPDTNPPPQLEVILPGSEEFNGFVGLTGTLSLEANQAAYITIDRNDAWSYANLSLVTVADINEVPIEENTIVLAIRLNTSEVWLWDGFYVSSGAPVPVPGTLELRVNQNANMKLVRGGTWSWANVGVPANFALYNTGVNSVSLGSSGDTVTWYGQGFTTTAAGNVTSAYMAISRAVAGAVSGNVTLQIYSNVAGLPGVLLGTSDPRAASSINTSFAPFPVETFTFSTPVAVANATSYFLVANFSAATGSPWWVGGQSLNPYAGGQAVSTSNSGGLWAANASYDFTFSVDGTAGAGYELSWDDDAYIQIPDLPENRNRILAGNIALPLDGDVAYVDVNRTAGAADDLTVNVAQIDSIVIGADRIIIARRTDNDVIVGNNSMLLVEGESKKLYAGLSDQNMTFIGATGEADDAPDYSSTTYIADGDSLVTALGKVDLRLTNLNWKDPVANFAALPGSGNTNGDVRMALDTRVVYTWVSAGSFWREIGYWKAPVANVAALPASNNADGDVRLVLDTRIPYTWHSATTEWLPVNSTGGGVKIIGGGTVSAALAGTTEVFSNTGFGIAGGGAISAYQVAKLVVPPATTWTISQIRTEIRNFAGFVGTWTMHIFGDMSGTPDETNIIASSSIAANTVPGSFTEVPWTFTVDPVLSTGTYWVGFISSEVSGIAIQQRSAGSTNGSFSADGISWNDTQPFGMEVDATTGMELSFTEDMFLEIKGLDYSENTIDVSESPISFGASLDVAYVTPNLSPGGPALTVTVDSLVNVPADALIIARREGDDIIVGSSSTRLKNGQSTELYAQESIQSRNFIRSTDFLRSDEPVTWTGTDLLFTTDIVLEGLNTRLGSTELWTIDVSDSPISLANGEVAYIEIDREAGGGVVSPVVSATVPEVTSENIEYIIIAKRVDALGAGYLHIPIHKQVLEPGQTVRLGASGSGDGDANTIRGRLEDRLLDSPWELVTPNIFKINKDDLVDGASTGAYSLVSRTFEFPVIGNTLVSTNMLDPDEFLANDDELRECELLAYWNEDGIDPLATYEVSRNGGNEWQTVDMERVGDTELWRGVHVFDEEASNQTLQTIAIGSSDGDNDLDSGSARQKVAQSFTVTNKELLRTIDLRLTKVGSPLGFYKVSVVKDSGGNPSSAIADLMSETNLLPISSVPAGTNTITHNLPDAVLTAGTYWIVIEGDAAYRGSYSNGVTELAIRSVSTGTPVSKAYNGTTWSALASATVYAINGITMDLRVRITSGTTDVMLDGYGIFYDKAPGQIASGIRNIEMFQFSGSLNTTDFLVSNFIVNPEQLKVYDIRTGQVYRYGAFTVNGQTVSFTSGQFLDPGETITLMFDQTTGGAFDNSDVNGLLLASNHLGSPDASIDRSVAGLGIYLRRPDGTLREIALDDSDNLVVYSV